MVPVWPLGKCKKEGFFWILVKYVIQHCFICRLSDFTVSEDAGIELKPCLVVHSIYTLHNLEKAKLGEKM